MADGVIRGSEPSVALRDNQESVWHSGLDRFGGE
jgi:hypothetical protein